MSWESVQEEKEAHRDLKKKLFQPFSKLKVPESCYTKTKCKM